MADQEIRHGGAIGEAAHRYGGDPSDWLDLSTGINPVASPLPPIPQEAWQRLPDAGLVMAARRAAGSFYGVDPRYLPLPVPGVQSAIQQLPTLVPPGRRAAIFAPTYGEYELVLRRAGVAVDPIDGAGDIDRAHGLVVVVTPNNPDGRVRRRAELLAIADRMAETGGYLVVDEAFADADPAESVARDAGAHSALVVLRSFGKIFGLAGVRLGFVLAAPSVLDHLSRALGPWAVSGPALAMAARLLGNDEAFRRIVETIAMRRTAMREVLVGAGLEICGETSLFFLIEHRDAARLHDALCRQHILTRTFDYAPTWLRFGLTPDRNADGRLAAALDHALRQARTSS